MRLTWKVAGTAMAAVAALVMGTFAVAHADGIESVTCPFSGHLSYTLERAENPTPDQTSAYDAIDTAMRQAVTFYNCHTEFNTAIAVFYDPSVPTANGSYQGMSIRFGSRGSMRQITAMHEISHVMGVGLADQWDSFVSNGVWTGANAVQLLRVVDNDPSAVLHADGAHFWPYGLNYPSEVKSDADLMEHCQLVDALRRDMGL